MEVRPWFYRRYNQWIQGAIAKTVWVQANNYYKSPIRDASSPNGLTAPSFTRR